MDRQETCEIPLASTGAARRALERRLNKCSEPDKPPPGMSGALRRTRTQEERVGPATETIRKQVRAGGKS